MNGEIGKQYLKDYLAETDQLFIDYLNGVIHEAAEISKIPGELFIRFRETARKGKKIRGGLVQLGYEIGGGKDFPAIQKASFVLELFHAAVLVHDDVMDQDSLRRGLPSLHTQYTEIGKALKVGINPQHYGESMAYCVGDAMFYLSWRLLMESDFSAEVKVAVGKIYADYVMRVVYGQTLDITNVSMHLISEKDVLSVLRYKTAEYTGVLPLLMGLNFAGVRDEKIIKAVDQYGVSFGWAFQIQDDILGLFGEEEDLGKPIGSDLREGKNTLLMLNLYRMGDDNDRQFLQKVLGNLNSGKEEVEELRRRVKASGAYEKTLELGRKYVCDGIAQIPQITTEKKYQEILESLICYMLERIS